MRWLTNYRKHEEIPEYWKDCIIGDPKSTYKHTIEELKEMGIIGIYEKEKENEDVGR